jgi:hypothetical protein
LDGSIEPISPPELWVLPAAITGKRRASKGQQAEKAFSLSPPEFLQLEFKEVEYERYDASGADLAKRPWFVRSDARMAKLADVADLKSSRSQ